ncbi:hypothetical protein HF670_08810 [Acidithiobacillus thiooxidans]|jgi:hypothetical protein|uniref:Uncharacterized protein n=2 Tax=Acidithiobacillus thiooxidans TaxID=930 RepID=A0A1C2HXN3_ACITH|nr:MULTISPECIES: hypothetical protein [Acidithiobacillus]MBE7565139.1 hypothetical protein [Acidithiobacillus sp. HP-11]MBU2743522.1 hypothetical protein [Acidithiobacillus albertensis]MBU2751215.1 hypothetical protein [Acidithiobacillus thiooxidans]MBU2791930.1 hypothetical protein [Acidithiobacillus thiooxidans]MBU2836612.1 hypothetical protein [Acidithiobacillus thiooxidans]
MSIIDLPSALTRALSLKNEDSLDAATIAAAEQLSKKEGLSLDAAVGVFGNDQLVELIGFLNDSMSCEQLSALCDPESYDAEQAREWEVTKDQYLLAHEIAVLSHRVAKQRDTTK